MTPSAPQDRLALVLNLVHRAHSVEGHSQQALDRIAEIAGESLGSVACTLVRVDLVNEYMMVLACWPHDSEFQRYMAERQIRLGDTLGPGTVQADDANQSNWLELYHLQETDHAVIRREIAARFGFEALLGCPIRIAGEVVGYLNHFIDESREFSVLERRLLEMLAHRAAAAFESKNREHTLNRYEQLSAILQQVDEAHSAEEVLAVVFDGALRLTDMTRGWISQLSRYREVPVPFRLRPRPEPAPPSCR